MGVLPSELSQWNELCVYITYIAFFAKNTTMQCFTFVECTLYTVMRDYAC